MHDQTWWKAKYREKNAWWTRDENSSGPHALLTNGDHSNGYFNNDVITEDPYLLYLAAEDLVETLMRKGLQPKDVDLVVGVPHGATRLAEAVYAHIKSRGGRCWSLSPDKVDEGKTKSFVFREKDDVKDQQILLVDDALTTGRSAEDVAIEAIRIGGHPLPYLGALVNRSGEPELFGKKVVSLITEHVPTWKPSNCLLCKLGSVPMRPEHLFRKK